jgi:nucleotide sugar dehydrogenase
MKRIAGLSKYHPESDRHVVQIIGLGFVGLTLAAVVAKKNKVLGVEISESVRDSVSSGAAHFYEAGLDSLLSAAVASGNLSTTKYPEKLESNCTYIITVGTPISNREVDLEALIRTTDQVVQAAKDNDLIIVRSTVSVGSCREIVQTAIENAGKRVLLAMCPERTVEGKAISELTELPQIIGGRDAESTSAACQFFQFHGVRTVEVSSLEAAEMTKLVNNTYRDLQFAFANEIATLCDSIGVSSREVIKAANKDYARSKIALPGLTAGPCLEKDPWILHAAGSKIGIDMPITRSSREVNENVVGQAFAFLEKRSPNLHPNRVLVAGLAFKGHPETSDTRGSLAFDVIRHIEEVFPKASIYTLDPLVQTKDLKGQVAKGHFRQLNSSIDPFDLVVIQHNGLSMLTELSENGSVLENATVLDFWDSGIESRVHANLNYYCFGGSSS